MDMLCLMEAAPPPRLFGAATPSFCSTGTARATEINVAARPYRRVFLLDLLQQLC